MGGREREREEGRKKSTNDEMERSSCLNRDQVLSGHEVRRFGFEVEFSAKRILVARNDVGPEMLGLRVS